MSVLLVLTVSGSTAYFMFASQKVDAEIATVQSSVSEYDSKIALLQTNRDIVALERIKANLPLIEKEVQASMAQKYLAELIQLGRKYTVYFTGFSFQNGKISTAATVVSDSILAMDPIVKISRLIHDFREPKIVLPGAPTATGSVVTLSTTGASTIASDTFELQPISLIAGQNTKRAFSIELTVR